MKFYILASLFILILVISHNIRKSKRARAESETNFWEKERMANQVRRKPLDDLDYIKIPLDALPMELLPEDEQVEECLRLVRELSTQPIVNLTGYSNTDLKLEYGTANITALTDYDQNYTLLVSALQKWAELLYQAGYPDETRRILEFAVNTRTDVSHTYSLLAKIYLEQGTPEKINELKSIAETLNSLNKSVILRHLASLPSD